MLENISIMTVHKRILRNRKDMRKRAGRSTSYGKKETVHRQTLGEDTG